MNKRGDSNKACSWEIFLKKNKKNSMLIRDFRVRGSILFKWHYTYVLTFNVTNRCVDRRCLWIWRFEKLLIQDNWCQNCPKEEFQIDLHVGQQWSLIRGQCRLLILTLILIGFWFKMIRLDLKNGFVYKNTSSLLVLLLCYECPYFGFSWTFLVNL